MQPLRGTGSETAQVTWLECAAGPALAGPARDEAWTTLVPVVSWRSGVAQANTPTATRLKTRDTPGSRQQVSV